jgi:diguanylate cyclase (GGDEF)-like protein/PAS domain S-box-containing protein
MIGKNYSFGVNNNVSLEKSLKSKLPILGTIVDNSFNEIYLFDATYFKFTYMNQQAQKNLGYTLQEMQEMHPWTIKPLYTQENFKSSVINREFSTLETLYQRKDGTQYRVEAKVQKMILNHEEYYVVIASDITQKYVYEEKLMLSKEVIDSISEAVVITDIDTTIIDVNPAYVKLSGYKREDIIGKTPKIFKSGRHDKKFYKDMWSKILYDGFYKGEIWDRKARGEVFLKNITITAVQDRNGKVKNYVGVFTDITNERNYKEELQEMAFTDSLTKLSNRAQFKNILRREMEVSLRTKSEGALLLLDLDMFKKVNDTSGHLVGDDLLVRVALRLKQLVRKSDEVSRIGGDEFTIILSSSVKKKNIQYVAQNIIEELEKPFVIGTHEIFISVSVGISIFPSSFDDINALIKSADLAMYKAKEMGRGNYQFFQDSMNEESEKNRNIEIELRQALNNGDIVPYYQPKINPRHGTISGVEALARWEHKTKGTLSPAYFIEVAEESNLIHELGEQMLIKSLTDIKKLNNDKYPEFSVAVNLSSKQFEDDNLIDKILTTVKTCEFNVQNLELEITESLIMKDVDRAINMMQDLRDASIKLSIDDFGTGYSSLNYLKNFPVSYLKIDKSFIDGIAHSKEDRAIVKTIMTMAEELGLGVIAEGIEKEEQESYLSEMACHLCQGYLYSKPLPLAELKEFLYSWNMKK